MCGIAGWLLRHGEREDARVLDSLVATLRHRGPDDHGTFHDSGRGVGLAHTRLSIIDLSEAGRQPMQSPSGRRLVFNGEIYNFADLRRELEARGHRFVSNTDCEVVLLGYDEWGSHVVRRLRGMFAFAVWSPQDESLFLARDPMGMKPLYYRALPRERGWAFASEVKAFRRLPGVENRVNQDALTQYLELGYTYDLHATSLHGVQKLPPGNTLHIHRSRVEAPRAYFTPPRPDVAPRASIEDREEELYAVLQTVVRQHLVADVPVGLLLSGGLDSSLLAALAAKHGPLTTLTMAFSESRVDERADARRVAQHVGSRHHELCFGPDEIQSGLEGAVDCVDDLFADWGVISTRLVYQRARQIGLKVVLVGEGADELFGGYPIFEQASRPSPFWMLRVYRRYCGRRWARDYWRFRRVLRGRLAESHGDRFHAVRLFESRHQLPNNYVMKVDKASMSVSVEARAPWLDQRVAELAYRTPESFLLSNGTNKYLLRFMARRRQLLPEDVAARPKFGASIAASWMGESPSFRGYARAVILDSHGWVDTLGLRDAMERYFDRGQPGYAFPRAISIFSNLAWRLLLLNLWSRRILGPGAARVGS